MSTVSGEQELPRATRSGAAERSGEELLSTAVIDRITGFHGAQLPVVSVYMTVEADAGARKALRTRARSLLHLIRPESYDPELQHDVRLSLREDVERIEAEVTRGLFKPGGLAIFSCARGGLFERVQLPRAVRDRIMVDATAWVRPMLAVLSEYQRCCVLVVDRESAHIWEIYVDQIRDVGKVRDRALRKPSAGGWQGLEEHRVRNKADELIRRHFRHVVAELDQLWRVERYDLLIVGGHEYELPGFLDFLPRHLRTCIAGTFTTDPHTASTGTIRGPAEEILERYERNLGRKQVAEVLERSAAGGLAAVGLEACLWAGSVAAVQTLLVAEGAVVPGVVCDESGWLALSGARCPLCGRPTRQTGDVIDELAEAVVDEGGAIRHVPADDGLGKETAAAELRFPLPPLPDGVAG
jgi:peptide subunit release factor 1 (eRF1)